MDMDHRRVSRVKVKLLHPVETLPSATESFQVASAQAAPAPKKPRKPRAAKPRRKSVAAVHDEPMPVAPAETSLAAPPVSAPAIHEPAPNAQEGEKGRDSETSSESSKVRENAKAAESK